LKRLQFVFFGIQNGTFEVLSASNLKQMCLWSDNGGSSDTSSAHDNKGSFRFGGPSENYRTFGKQSAKSAELQRIHWNQSQTNSECNAIALIKLNFLIKFQTNWPIVNYVVYLSTIDNRNRHSICNQFWTTKSTTNLIYDENLSGEFCVISVQNTNEYQSTKCWSKT
jgi:hypothetical protein